MSPQERVINDWFGRFRFWINLNIPLHAGHGMTEKQRQYRRDWHRKSMQDAEYVRKTRERKIAWLDRGDNREKNKERARRYYMKNREKVLAQAKVRNSLSKLSPKG
jgi:broad specificity polyphosphatase/5'/3'-nucleotidase SurE